jgi:hypothetical protein
LEYLDSIVADLDLCRGRVDACGLDQSDHWIANAPLANFRTWRAQAFPVTAASSTVIPAWWTVPQAAVWIAIRDLSQGQSLDDRARASLFVAGELVPGAQAAA